MNHRIRPTGTKPREMFNKGVPADIQRELVKAIISVYERAHKDCFENENFGPQEARDVLPHWRRALIETGMAEIAARLGWKCSLQENKAKNCSHRLIIGDRIVLSQSKVEERATLPRDAEFRKGYAASPQMVFDFMRNSECAEREDNLELYGIIVHKPCAGNEGIPEFIDVLFPDRDYKEIVGRIRLLEKFPDVAPKVAEVVEEVLSRPAIKVRREIQGA